MKINGIWFIYTIEKQLLQFPQDIFDLDNMLIVSVSLTVDTEITTKFPAVSVYFRNVRKLSSGKVINQ